jgi:hypothetical protein
MVEKVELMQTPPPEYATYDGSVINIVTKKGRVGYYQKLWLSAGTNGQRTGGTYLSYKSKKITFNGHFNIAKYNVIGNSRSTRQNLYTDSTNFLNSKSNYTNKTSSPTVRLESNIDINKLSNLSTITNFDILSQIIPPISLKYKGKAYNDATEDFNNSNNVIEIINGNFYRGQIDKGVLSDGSKGLIQRIYNDFGNGAAADFIDNLQNIVTEFMKTDSYSVGINDLIADQETNEQIGKVISAKKNAVQNM